MARSHVLAAAVRRSLLALATVSTGSLLSAGALAQTSADGDPGDEATALDTVQVTGSRIQRADIEGAVPVTVIDRAQIDASGDVSVAEVLRDSTFASFGNFRPQSGSSAQSLATVDLRGTGSGRTLLLIDGRRAPSNPMSASSGGDLNAIPLAAVERIEILSDGASAVYGSDAIGGVVNIVTRKDFNGAELRYGFGSTEVKGGDTEEMSVVFGSSSDRTRMVGGISASKRGMVFTRDQIGGDALGVSLYGNNYYNPYTGQLAPVPGFACNQGAFYFLGNGLCSFNFNAVAANEAKLGNKAVFLRADHQINDRWNFYATATVSKVESFGRYAPVPGVVVVDDGSPNDVVPFDGQPTYFYHRFAAAGNRDSFTDTTNSDFLVGFQGQLSDTVGIDFGLRRTDYKYTELGRGYVVSALANQFANSGQYDLSDPFGTDPAVLSALQATIGREARWQTDEIYGLVDFNVFEMGGGTSNAVVGAEYREDTLVDQYDSLSEGGQILGSSGNSAGGSRNASAVYFEWILPFSQSFDVTLAGRYDDYSDYGSDFSPKVSMRWQALETLVFRGSYGEGFRAPSLDILTQKPSFGASPVNDPATCVALGQPANCQVQVDTYTLANPNLTSETSRQYSLGLVFDPLEWLVVTLDYYHIEVDEAIAQLSAQAVINSDIDADVFGPVPPGLSVSRAADGRITEVVAGFSNRGILTTAGLDLRIDTTFDLGGLGDISSQLAVSEVLDFDVDDGYGNIISGEGMSGTPQRRANLDNRWSRGDFSVGWSVRYIGGHGSGATRVGAYTTHDLQVAWKTPWDGTLAVGATNVGDRYPQLVAFNGRPFNFNLYDAYGRNTYVRYTQAF